MNSILRPAALLVIIVASIVLTAAIGEVVELALPQYAELVQLTKEFPAVWLLVAVGVGFAAFYATHQELLTKLEIQNEQIAALKRTQFHLETELKTERDLRGTDVLTGLPNQVRFARDMQRLYNETFDYTDFSLIYIDLFDLKKVNDTQGDEFGSRYIQGVAHRIESAMYRKEKIYLASKRPESSGHESAIYRSHNGGDEFYLVIRGNEVEALFFLRRLIIEMRDNANEIIEFAQNPLKAQMQVRVGFRAGVIELENYQSPDESIEAVKAAFLHARLSDLPSAPSKYIICGTPPAKQNETQIKLLKSIDKIIDQPMPERA